MMKASLFKMDMALIFLLFIILILNKPQPLGLIKIGVKLNSDLGIFL
jgi:hypothetical protein